MEKDLLPKRLELLREAVPAASHVAVVHAGRGPIVDSFLREAETAAKGWGVQLTSVELGSDLKEWDHAFQAMVSDGVAALLPLQSPRFFVHRAYLAELAARHRLPAMYQARGYVEAGGLMSYGPHIDDVARRLTQGKRI